MQIFLRDVHVNGKAVAKEFEVLLIYEKAAREWCSGDLQQGQI